MQSLIFVMLAGGTYGKIIISHTHTQSKWKVLKCDWLVPFFFTCHVNAGLFQVCDTECDATQTTSPCSPALGGYVNIKLMNNASGYKLKCYKNVTSGPEVVFKLKKRVTIEGAYQNRVTFFTDNGTLQITNVTKSDTGQYILVVHNADGKHEKDIKFILKVKGKCRHVSYFSFYTCLHIFINNCFQI